MSRKLLKLDTVSGGWINTRTCTVPIRATPGRRDTTICGETNNMAYREQNSMTKWRSSAVTRERLITTALIGLITMASPGSSTIIFHDLIATGRRIGERWRSITAVCREPSTTSMRRLTDFLDSQKSE